MISGKITYGKSRTVLIGYLILLFFSFIVIFIIQSQTNKVFEQEIQSQTTSTLMHSRDLLDLYMDEVKRQSLQLVTDHQIDEFLKLPTLQLGSPSVQVVIDASTRLNSFETANPFLSEVYVFSNSNGYLLSSSNAYLHMDKVYKNALSFEGYTYEQWLHQVLKKKHKNEFLPALNVRINGRAHRVIPFLRSLPLNSSYLNTGKMVLLLNEELILSILKNTISSPNGWAFIVDVNGDQLLTSCGNPIRDKSFLKEIHTLEEGCATLNFNNDEYFVLTAVTKQSGWQLVTVLPGRELRDKISFIWKIYAIVSLFLLILISLYSLFIIISDLKHQRELRILLGGAVSYEDMRERIGQINTRMDSLQELSTPEINRTFMYKLLTGSFVNRYDPLLMAGILQYEMEKGPYLILSFCFKGQDSYQINEDTISDIRFSLIFLQKTLRDQFLDDYMILQEDGNIYSVLIWGQSFDSDKLADLFYPQLADKIPMNLYLGIGTARQNLYDVSESYRESCQTLEYISMLNQPGTFFYENLPDRDFSYFYPIDAENQLINLVLNGNTEQVTIMINSLLDENFHSRRLSSDAYNGFIGAMAGTLNRIKNRISEYSESFSHDLSGTALSETDIIGVFVKYSEQTSKVRQNKDDLMKQKIIHYLDDSYSDVSMTLDSLAKKFDCKESHLYYFFTNHLEITFTQYLEKLRLDNATRYLKENKSYTVNEIAAKVGYSNPQTFRRAFKKRMGVTPTEYRG